MKFPNPFKKSAKLVEPSKRTFGGKTENFADNRERHFYQRMLRAYLKGSEYFNFGFHDTPIGRRPTQYKVLEKYV